MDLHKKSVQSYKPKTWLALAYSLASLYSTCQHAWAQGPAPVTGAPSAPMTNTSRVEIAPASTPLSKPAGSTGDPAQNLPELNYKAPGGPQSVIDDPAKSGARNIESDITAPPTVDAEPGGAGPGNPPVSATIRYDVDADGQTKPSDPSRSGEGISIFQSLDEALAKSPRAAAIRALFPVAKSEFMRATEQASPQFNKDSGVAAEQTFRTGTIITVEPPWKLVFRLIVAKKFVDQQKLDLMADLWRLRAEVRRTYTEVVVAQETLETQANLYDLAHTLRVVTEKRFQAGDVPELDLLKARLAESQYDVERLVAERRVIRAKQQLNIILGRKPEAPITVPRLPAFLGEAKNAVQVKHPLLPDFSRPERPLENFIALSNKFRYELKSLDQQLLVNKANLQRTYGNMFPNVQYWTGNSNTYNLPSGPRLSAYYFGVNMPTNLTDFGQGDLAKFKALARQLNYQVGSQKNIITGEVSSAYNNLLAARQKLQNYEEHILHDSFEVARLARRSYEVGQSDITSTLQTQQNNVLIRSLYLQAIQLYQDAFTELEMACGIPLLESD
ncbi:MAG: TolC family protein [Candidatus Melainabacteria bacterium]|nr:TolC family protein [Candidatus Melainabacteria bacterium]